MSNDGQELAEAWRKWLRTEEGKRCTDARTLGAEENQAVYLRNRLWWAFMAGARAVESSK